MLIPTLREAPAEAEAASHQLLLRAGFIRQTAAGIYSYLPLGWRVLHKLTGIIREEMNRAGAQEVLLPAMQPAELWQESGRYGVYGPELIRLRDRHDREFALGPTHEEVITSLVRNEVSSYRQLPLTLYQIQTKFRDERRPRFGLLRGREFLMKDAYSFDADWEGLDRSYWEMYEAYNRIFTRIGLRFRPVEADAGAIGGEGGTHEFMALADIGEDTIVSCAACDYAANLEKAEYAAPPQQARQGDLAPERAGLGEKDAVASPEHARQAGTVPTSSPALARQANRDIAALQADAAEQPPMEVFDTPGIRTIEELAAFTGLEASAFVKTLIYAADGKPVAVLVRGDREVNEIKVKNALNAEEIELADKAVTERVTGAETGFAGPAGLDIPILMDREVASTAGFIAGANETDRHVRNVVAGRDFAAALTGDFRNAAPGDACPRCSGRLQFSRGIEIGHVFKLGTKYSATLGAVYTDASGKEQTMIMGCYGIGVSRIISAVAEQCRDGNGLVWPASIAPYAVHVIPVSVKDESQLALAEELYGRLAAAGIETLLDDRDERPGVKFKDADLLGIPVRIIVGKQAAQRQVEWVDRAGLAKNVMSAEDAFMRILRQDAEEETAPLRP